MSLSNKLTLDKVDVNGKRVVMRYASCFHPTQLIGCEIIWRLLPNYREGADSSDICRTFRETYTPIMLTRRRRAYSQLCVTWFRAPARLQEVNLSRFHPCYVPERRCCMDATQWCGFNKIKCSFSFVWHPINPRRSFEALIYLFVYWFNGKMSNLGCRVYFDAIWV